MGISLPETFLFMVILYMKNLIALIANPMGSSVIPEQLINLVVWSLVDKVLINTSVWAVVFPLLCKSQLVEICCYSSV